MGWWWTILSDTKISRRMDTDWLGVLPTPHEGLWIAGVLTPQNKQLNPAVQPDREKTQFSCTQNRSAVPHRCMRILGLGSNFWNYVACMFCFLLCSFPCTMWEWGVKFSRVCTEVPEVCKVVQTRTCRMLRSTAVCETFVYVLYCKVNAGRTNFLKSAREQNHLKLRCYKHKKRLFVTWFSALLPLL